MITLEQGIVIAGRYTLVRQLAKGGMGSVWIARHRDLEIDVTVKFMAPSLVIEAEARMRFEREAKVAARLRSQHVVQVHDYGVENDTPYIIMELLKGESLSTRIEREGRLDLPTMARLLVQIGKALRTAHEAALVHRDLKPGNIFLAQKDEEEVIKVLDFGIAKSGPIGDAQASTQTGVLLGSIHYMSPEQIRSSRTVDHRSDLWSVGVIAYRVLTGRLPFPGASLGDVLVRVCTEEAPLASVAAPGLPARLDGFFARALARDPEQRFQSATELSDAFRAVALEPTPVEEPRSRPQMNLNLTMPMGITSPVLPAPAVEIRMDAGAKMPLPQPIAVHVAPAPPEVTRPIAMTQPIAPQRVTPPLITPAPSWSAPPVAPSPVAVAPPQAVSTRRSEQPTFSALDPGAPQRRRSSWPVWAAVAAVVLAAIVGVAASSSGGSREPTNIAPSAAVASPPALRSAPASPTPREPTSAAVVPAPTPPPVDSVPVRAPAVEPTIRPKSVPKPRVNPLDRSD